ncbi:MAG TPA: Calx-beta domain-containing protein [Sedimentisphaerales bacterium]|nr:Calx-beta domain-containing protein [Sedimentisphaerales bacterium]
MCRKVIFLTCMVLLAGLVNTAGAKVELKFDCGLCDIGWVQAGWISIPTCGFYEGVGGTVVDVNIVPGGECTCRGYFTEPSDPPCDSDATCPATGPLAGVEQDFIMSDDCGPTSSCGDFTLIFSGLDAGAPYTLKTYHNRLDEPGVVISGVQVTGATNVTAPSTIPQTHPMFANDTPPIVTFTAGAGDVSVKYLHPTSDCGSKGCQVFLNGFILEGGFTEVSFESASSGALESVSPAYLWVTLSAPAEGDVTVSYQVTGGTATKNVDYTIPAGPLVFHDGEISKAIQITIVNDGTDEQDETIEVTLTGVTGTNTVLGDVTKHTYSILDPRPAVGFQTARSVCREDQITYDITVTLSRPSVQTVTVQYNASGGTAIRNIDYYLTAGTLTFTNPETSKIFSITVVNDGIEEQPETIGLVLSGAVNAKYGIKNQTCTLFDPWSAVSFPKFKLDMGCPSDPSTFRDDWTPWAIFKGCDGKAYSGTGISDIAGTGIDAYICTEGDTASGNLRKIVAGPISNTFYSRYREIASEQLAVEFTLSGPGLVAGEYWLYTYHNAVPAIIPEITVTGEGVVQKEPVTDVPIQGITSDYYLVPSVIKFLADGSGPVTVTYREPNESSAVVNAFELRTAVRPLVASNPYPADEALDVDPNVVLTWQWGAQAQSHNVYLGTDFNDVNDATTSSAVYVTNVTDNSYDPPDLLAFGVTYYWRVDEVKGATTWKGEVWYFTTDNGKARYPSPMDGGRGLADRTLLSWKAGPHASWHDLYYGTDFNDVNDATTGTLGVYIGRKDLDDANYNPGLLDVGAIYYWRVDEIGTTTYIRGDVWSFTATGRIDLKVDLALAYCGVNDYNQHWPTSAKPGWNIWAQPRWQDMYGHDAVLNDGSGKERSLGSPFNGPGIGGTGIMAGLTCVYEGRGGLIMSGPERCNLNSNCDCPTVSGNPLYEPICNTWFQITDFGEPPGSTILLTLYNLPPGEYALLSYHNRFKGERNGDQPHWECIAPYCGEYDCHAELPMTAIEAMALAGAQNLYGSGYDYGKLIGGGTYPVGSPDGVELFQGAYDVPIQQVTTDDQLVPSLIKFRTDGSAVLVTYTGTCCVEDDLRNSQNSSYHRLSGRAALNAFRLVLLSEVMKAKDPAPRDGAEDVSPDVVLAWEAGPAAAAHQVYIGTSFTDVNDAGTSSAEYKATTADPSYDPPGYLEFGKTYYWRIDEVNEAESPGYWRGSVWSFMVDNGKARDPSPDDGTQNVSRAVQLSWSPGALVTSHDVYFGTNLNDVTSATTSSPEHRANLPAGSTSYDPPGHLDFGVTYYWRIDERNPVADKKGDIWSFRVETHMSFEDFEAYDETTNPIIYVWLDGLRYGWPPVSGAAVWLGMASRIPPEPVHGAQQSMWYGYDDTGWENTPYYSEAERAVGDPCDWTFFSALTLWFYGDPNNVFTGTDQMYVRLEDSTGPGSYPRVNYGDSNNMNDIKVAEWHEWNMSLQQFADAGVDLADLQKIVIGFGDVVNPTPGGYGIVYFDDIGLYAVGEVECYDGMADYAQWDLVGMPGCWCYPRQCLGDADGLPYGKNNYWVAIPDLTILKAAWNKPKEQLVGNEACADFDHLPYGKNNYRVAIPDLTILKANWNITNGPAGTCSPGNRNP